MANHPTILVCGFGRCGSSLMMQMLHRGGIPTAGEWPSFEDDHCGVVGGKIDPEWMASKVGYAIKILDPHLIQIPRGNYVAIWMGRDDREQAKSQAKFAHLLLGLPRPDRTMVRKLAASYQKDRPTAMRALERAGVADILHIRFEHLVGPGASDAIGMVEDFLGRELDVAAMRGAIKSRGPSCAPGLDMEMALISEVQV